MNYACSVPTAVPSKYKWENFYQQYLDFPTERVLWFGSVLPLHMWVKAQFIPISKSASFLRARRVISYSGKVKLWCAPVLPFNANQQNCAGMFCTIWWICWRHCDLIENIFVHIYYSPKCFISGFYYVRGNDLCGVITCWPFALFWIGCPAIQGPFSFVSETKTSVQELSWTNVENWEKQFCPTEFFQQRCMGQSASCC